MSDTDWHDANLVLDTVELMVRGTMDTLRPGEELHAVAFLVRDEQPYIQVADLRPAFADDASKFMFKLIAPSFAKQSGAHTVVMVTEAWILVKPIDELKLDSPDYVRPRDHPDHQEVVLISLESKDGTMTARSYPILNINGKRMMGEAEVRPEGGTVMSGFQFFPREPS